MTLTLYQLRKIMPLAKRPQDFIAHLNATFSEFKINTKDRMAFFLAQVAHESGELNFICEIASGKAYEGRKDLGNDEPGDGEKYRGHGLIQITGKKNHFDCADYFDVDRQVICQWLQDPKGATLSAGWFWDTRKLNDTADRQAFGECTKKINGGTNGIESRLKYLAVADRILSGTSTS